MEKFTYKVRLMTPRGMISVVVDGPADVAKLKRRSVVVLVTKHNSVGAVVG